MRGGGAGVRLRDEKSSRGAEHHSVRCTKRARAERKGSRRSRRLHTSAVIQREWSRRQTATRYNRGSRRSSCTSEACERASASTLLERVLQRPVRDRAESRRPESGPGQVYP